MVLTKSLLLHVAAFMAFNNIDVASLHAVLHSQPLNNISQKLPGQHSLLRLRTNAPYFLNAFDLLRRKARSTAEESLRQNSPTWRQLFPSPFSEPYNYFAVHSAVQTQIVKWKWQESTLNTISRTGMVAFSFLTHPCYDASM